MNYNESNMSELSTKNKISSVNEACYRNQVNKTNISNNEVYPEKVENVNKMKKVEPVYSPRYGSMNYAGRVLVYGGSGFLGSEIVNYFFERKWVSYLLNSYIVKWLYIL